MSGKLVRDLIPQIIKKDGRIPLIRKASKKEFEKLLKFKLLEESRELNQAKGKYNIKEEIADVLEVLISLADLKKLDWKEILNLRKQKAKKRGRFLKAYILEEIK